MFRTDLPFDLELGYFETHHCCWRARAGDLDEVRGTILDAAARDDLPPLAELVADRLPAAVEAHRAHHEEVSQDELDELARVIRSLDVPAEAPRLEAPAWVHRDWIGVSRHFRRMVGQEDLPEIMRLLSARQAVGLAYGLARLEDHCWQEPAAPQSWAEHVRLALASTLVDSRDGAQFGLGGFIGGPWPHLRWWTCRDGPDGGEDVVPREAMGGVGRWLDTARLYDSRGLGGGGMPWMWRGEALAAVLEVVEQDIPDTLGYDEQGAAADLAWFGRHMPEHRVRELSPEELAQARQLGWQDRRARFLARGREVLEAGDVLLSVEGRASIMGR